MNAVPGPRRAHSGPHTGPHPEVPRAAGPVDTAGPPSVTGRPGETSVPAQRTAADVYRVTEEQVHRARMAVARNAEDPDDCRELLDMLGLIGDAGEPPPVRR